MIEYKFSDFLRIAREIVIYNKALDNKECLRLNSFMIIDSQFDFETDSFEAKAEKAYYFSRNETKIMFPALVLSLGQPSLSGLSKGTFKNFCHPFSMGIVDQYFLDCKNCDACGKRTKLDIYFDAETLLRKILDLIAQIKLFKVTKDAVDTFVYDVQPLIDMKIAEGFYDSAIIVKSETALVAETFRKNNENLTISDLPLTKLNTLAKYTPITICDACSTEELMEFSYKKYKNERCC